MKQLLSNIIIVIWCFLFGCTSNGQDMKQAKISCYTDRLNELVELPLYNQVMSQFIDTFKVMKNDKQYFGASEIVANKIDEAIFFNASKTECLLIVLKKNSLGLVFGSARIIRGILFNEKWQFKPSIDYVYSKDYFNSYSDNSFGNISHLARYSVLTDGSVKRKGCEIDEHYWFVHLKQ